MRMSRRSFAVGGAGAALYASLTRASAQNPPAPLTRFDVATPQGEAMLEKYARGVAKMMDIAQTPERHPRSWLFQWYTHAVDPDRSTESEIARIYEGATPNDPQRLLALATWNTCQPHGANGLPQDGRMFLPWHRMYLYHFERIIRAILPDDTFTLPYWDYTTPGQRAIPQQFRMPNDPLYKVLFRENRNRGQNGRARVNDGEPIDRDRPNSPLNLSVLAKARYEPVGADLGFNATLDGNLHGQVHVLVGDTSNMGDVPTAARDPIFWLHHCNVDRLWAAWNKGGRPNPGGTFLTQSFAFGDERGVRATSTVRDFVDTERIAADPYRYDKLPPLPPMAAATVDENVIVDAVPVAIAQQAQPGAVRLAANAAVPVPLSPIAVPMSAHLEGGSQRVFLVLQDVQATTQPNVLYDVFLDAPSGAPASKPLGTVNFFGATHSHGGHGSMASMGRTFSFDVTDVLAATGAAAPTVRIAPDGSAIGSSSPTVGRVILIRQ